MTVCGRRSDNVNFEVSAVGRGRRKAEPWLSQDKPAAARALHYSTVLDRAAAAAAAAALTDASVTASKAG